MAKAVRVCTDCSHDPPSLHSRSFAKYISPLDAAILHPKYRPDRRLANVMGVRLAEVYRNTGWQAELITAVPLSPDRRKQRGYNQAGLLAAALAGHIGLPFSEDTLVRRRETGTQVGLGRAERRVNVSGAFDASRTRVGDKSVIIVDDLYTTGATLRACAASLIDAGASRVLGLTVARAGHIDPGASKHGGHTYNESPN